MLEPGRVGTATARNQRVIPEEAVAGFQTVYECPHCGRPNRLAGIATRSGVVVCHHDACLRQFKLVVPPPDSQPVSGLLLGPLADQVPDV
jgi:transcription elongation factor Elf1